MEVSNLLAGINSVRVLRMLCNLCSQGLVQLGVGLAIGLAVYVACAA